MKIETRHPHLDSYNDFVCPGKIEGIDMLRERQKGIGAIGPHIGMILVTDPSGLTVTKAVVLTGIGIAHGTGNADVTESGNVHMHAIGTETVMQTGEGLGVMTEIGHVTGTVTAVRGTERTTIAAGMMIRGGSMPEVGTAIAMIGTENPATATAPTIMGAAMMIGMQTGLDATIGRAATEMNWCLEVTSHVNGVEVL